jgi:transcriptional regulator with XRE-family HTH domain
MSLGEAGPSRGGRRARLAWCQDVRYNRRMTTMIDESAARLARRLRLEREARGWSLADLAARSQVAKATISKIEREEMSPTAATLVRLASAFDLTLAGLLLRAEQASRLSCAAGQPVWRDPETGYRRRQVFTHPDHPVEVAQIELPPGRRVAFPAASYAHIRQLVWVQAGRLTVLEGGARHDLEAGDCLGFGPPGEVTLGNETDASCAYTVILARS